MNLDEKKEFLNEHFYYEFLMIAHALELKIQNPSRQEITNMVIELLGIHTRSLIEFFYDPPKKDYARATDFIDKKIWLSVRPPLTTSLKLIRDRGNNEIMHLTYKRISGIPSTKNWDMKSVFDDIKNLKNVFIDNLHPLLLDVNLTSIR